MNNEEIRVITLVRKAGLDGEQKCGGSGTEKHYYTTDYFDLLITEAYGLEVPLNQWINEDSSLIKSNGDTAVQKYSLYFSNHIYKKYEENQQELNRGNPFEQHDNLKFLSVIHVYISPEILSRLKNKREKVWSKGEDDELLDDFLNDLYDVLEKFRKTYLEHEFVYRIYHALSAGDFVIVVKSRAPELSFGMASYIRSRVSEQNEKKLAVYKTYTLLAFENNIDGWEKNTKRLFKEGNDSKFVLRGCYSWKYWAEKGHIKNINGIDRLNGRYDISVGLTEQEFEMLYHRLIRKNGESGEADSCEKNKVGHLSWLIDHDYLSYINERYLMEEIEIELKDTDTNSMIELREEDREELRIVNRKYVEQISEKQNKLEEECKSVCKEHKILKRYLSLLKRQIGFCSVLNEQSDTQIYAAGMGKLLNTVFDSLDKYNKIYNTENDTYISADENNQLGELIIKYVRKAVYSINTYMEYVRNNNLQSLQTPNYNIESNMGMEKILIGYGEYLREFIKFYLSKNKKCENTEKEFLPIIVPDMNSYDINVEALFPAGKTMRLDCEGEIAGDKKLLIINSPSIMELEDIPMAMAMLSHEIAHQFRYEPRFDRNQVLVGIFATECAEMITNKLLDDFQMEHDILITFPKIKIMLQNKLMDMFKEVLTSDKSAYAVDMDASLDYLKEELSEKFLQFFGDFAYTSKLDRYLKLFISQTGGQSTASVVDIKAVTTLYDIVEAGDSFKYEEIKEAVSAYMAELESKGIVVLKNYLFMDELMTQLEFEDKIQRVGKNAEKHVACMYESLTKAWGKQSKKYKKKIRTDISVDDYRMWALTGRYFGLDAAKLKDTQAYEENKKKFSGKLKRITVREQDIQDAKNEISLYREITSDIFMCCIMNLSAFSYLNIIATNMWEMDLVTNSYMKKRIISIVVILSVKSNTDEKQARQNYIEACLQIMETLEREIVKVLPKEKECFHKIINLASAFLDDDTKRTKDEYREKVEEFRQRLIKEHAYKNDIFIKIDKLLRICNVLIKDGDGCIEYLYNRVFLKEDYFKAYSILSAFRDEMQTDIKMNRLKSLNDSISEYLGRLYETGMVRDKVLNRKSVEFLLRMYYNYKFRNAGNEEELE